MASHTYHSEFKPGDKVAIADDIEGYIVKVSFTIGRDMPSYTIEWFSNGCMEEGEFFPVQIKGKING